MPKRLWGHFNAFGKPLSSFWALEICYFQCRCFLSLAWCADFTAVELLLIFHPLDGDLWLLEQRLNPLPLLVSAVSHASHRSMPLHSEEFDGQGPIKSNFLFILDLPCFKSGRCMDISSQQTHKQEVFRATQGRRIKKKKASAGQHKYSHLLYGIY